MGTDVSAHASDYDDSTIITAYSEVGDGWYISDNGLISSDFTNPLPTVDSTLTQSPSEDIVNEERTIRKSPTIVQYIVQPGDTLAKISDRYDVSIDAISWANDLSPGDTLKPWMTLKVPPISWVIHKVAQWDTLSEISAKYNIDVDDIMKVNNISDVTAIRVGKELIIPWAVKKIVQKSIAKTDIPPGKGSRIIPPTPSPTPQKTPTPIIQSSGLQDRYSIKYTGLSRGFAAGNCTWYVAQNKSVSWRGNANQWIRNAKAVGVKTGQAPIPWSIIQFSGRGYNRSYGHVGIVADVTDDYVIVKDMNYRGLYEVTIRKVPRDDATIDWYIYVN